MLYAIGPCQSLEARLMLMNREHAANSAGCKNRFRALSLCNHKIAPWFVIDENGVATIISMAKGDVIENKIRFLMLPVLLNIGGESKYAVELFRTCAVD